MIKVRNLSEHPSLPSMKGDSHETAPLNVVLLCKSCDALRDGLFFACETISRRHAFVMPVTVGPFNDRKTGLLEQNGGLKLRLGRVEFHKCSAGVVLIIK